MNKLSYDELLERIKTICSASIWKKHFLYCYSDTNQRILENAAPFIKKLDLSFLSNSDKSGRHLFYIDPLYYKKFFDTIIESSVLETILIDGNLIYDYNLSEEEYEKNENFVVYDFCSELIRLIRDTKSVRELSMSECGLDSDDLVQFLGTLGSNHNLTSLDISANRIMASYTDEIKRWLILNRNVVKIKFKYCFLYGDPEEDIDLFTKILTEVRDRERKCKLLILLDREFNPNSRFGLFPLDILKVIFYTSRIVNIHDPVFGDPPIKTVKKRKTEVTIYERFPGLIFQ